MKSNRNKLSGLSVRTCCLIIKRKCSPVIVCFGFLSMWFLLYRHVFQGNQVSVPDWVKTEDYPPFEPDVHEDFPTGPEFEPRIPHILHQAYVDNYIPTTFASNINNFLERNSDWKYFLWTEQSSRKLIIKKYPSLLGSLTLQMNFKDQTEILRYVVLHEFGGVYAEMPLQWLRPLRKITFKYACVITTLPFERASLGYKKPYLLNNELIFCRAKHPFLKQIIDRLPLYQPMLENEDFTGPHFVTSQLMIYNKQKYYKQLFSYTNSSYFFASKLLDAHEDTVFVPNSNYFSFNLESLYVFCDDFINLSFIEKRGCVELQRGRGFNKFAFTYNRGKRPRYESILNFLFRVEISHIAGEHLIIY